MRLMRSNSNDKPLVFLKLGNGAWYYNYNIEEVERENESGEKEKSFDYDTVQVWGTPTTASVKKAVIAEYWDVTQEINLANNYERFRLGLTKDESFRYDYVEYLKKTDEIKKMVDSDFKENEELIN